MRDSKRNILSSISGMKLLTKTISLICVITLAAQMIPAYAHAQELESPKQSSPLQQSIPDIQQDTGSTASTITYDAWGRVYKTTDGITGITTTYTYDSIGRLLSSTSTNGLTQWVTYDVNNKIASSHYSLSGGTTYKMTYMYGTTPLQKESYIYGLKINDVQKIAYTYDALGRMSTKSLGTNLAYTTKYRYLDNTDNTTTYMLAGIKNGTNAEITYTYDVVGNITHIYEGATLKKSYTYDNLGQLTRENDVDAGKTYTYTYDNAGNILSKTTYAYTTGTLGSIQASLVYAYGDSNWKDKLTSISIYGAGSPTPQNLISTKTYTYDAIGNPTSYGGAAMTWAYGRRLSSVNVSGVTTTYTYDDAGIRTSKKVGSTTTTYTLSGSTILRQVTGATTLDFFYDETGQAIGFKYNSTEYWYIRNAQSDVIGIVNNAGTQVVTYTYDAWGNPISVTGSLASTVGASNPYRYRGYYFDTETGFYYCNSRYYDPANGRWINADGQLNPGNGLLGMNLYTYCGNDPVNRIDPTGEAWWHWAIIAAIVVVAAAAVVITAGGALAAVGAVTAVASGMAAATTASTIAAGVFIGVSVTAAVVTFDAITQTDSFEEFLDYGSWETVATVVIGGVIGGLEGGIIASAQSVTIPKTAVNNNPQCFVAGTLVSTESGLVPIEEISVGDMVWASDPSTGEIALKEVVQTFVNKASELVHVFVDGEKITTTPEHPFYVLDKEWTGAAYLCVGDILVLQDGKYAYVTGIEHETPEASITVYNFEVEGFHTYYVGSSSVLVHNTCGGAPGEYLAGKAPTQVTPGTTQLQGQYVGNLGRVEPWTAHYDQFGRLIARTDFNAGNIAAGIPSIHYHTYGWGPGQIMAPILKHVPGQYIP